MALNRDRVGATYEPYTYEVSREKIREYARAVGETDPRCFSDDEDCVAPPTFAACFTITQPGAAIFADEDLGAHTAVLHGSQAYEFHSRPLEPGDRLVCTPRITDIRDRGGTEFLTVETDCRFQGTGERCVVARNTLVFVSSPPDVEVRT